LRKLAQGSVQATEAISKLCRRSTLEGRSSDATGYLIYMHSFFQKF
jgi:hypothetical protein